MSSSVRSVPRCSGLMTGASGSRSWSAERISTRLIESMPRSASSCIPGSSISGGIARLLRHHLQQDRPAARRRPAGAGGGGRGVGGSARRATGGAGGDGDGGRPVAEASGRRLPARRAARRGRGGGAARRRGRRRRGQPEGAEGQALLLFEEALEGALGLVLAFEELPVQGGGLLAQLLERDEVLLRRAEAPGRSGRGRPNRSGRRAGMTRLTRDGAALGDVAVGRRPGVVVRSSVRCGPGRCRGPWSARRRCGRGRGSGGGRRCHGRACGGDSGRGRGRGRVGRDGPGVGSGGVGGRAGGVVGPAHLDGQAGLAGRAGRRSAPSSQRVEGHRIAERREFGQGRGEVGEVPALAARGVDGDRRVRAARRGSTAPGPSASRRGRLRGRRRRPTRAIASTSATNSTGRAIWPASRARASSGSVG